MCRPLTCAQLITPGFGKNLFLFCLIISRDGHPVVSLNSPGELLALLFLQLETPGSTLKYLSKLSTVIWKGKIELLLLVRGSLLLWKHNINTAKIHKSSANNLVTDIYIYMNY